jgi:hypothetical protein
MEPEGPLLCSQECAIGPCPKPPTYLISQRFILTLFALVRLDLSSGLFCPFKKLMFVLLFRKGMRSLIAFNIGFYLEGKVPKYNCSSLCSDVYVQVAESHFENFLILSENLKFKIYTKL